MWGKLFFVLLLKHNKNITLQIAISYNCYQYLQWLSLYLLILSPYTIETINILEYRMSIDTQLKCLNEGLELLSLKWIMIIFVEKRDEFQNKLQYKIFVSYQME